MISMKLQVHPPGSDGYLKTGANTYSSAIADAQNYMRWLVDTFRPYLRGRILEVGIGHGHYSAFLGECGQYLGVDLDEESVAAARANFPARRFEHCDILNRLQLHALSP